MKNFLQEIINLKKKELDMLKVRRPMTDFVDSQRLLKRQRHFKEAIQPLNRINLIAEIKKKSPSRRKVFFKELKPAYLAGIYARCGATAISVLTDERYFGGHVSHMLEVRRVVSVPILRKDFIIDEYQIYESRYFGADAILLIARILKREEIKSFIHLAKRLGMDSVVEIHDERDLEKAILCDAKIIGINNRDLDTFTVNLDTTLRLASRMPKEIIKISESGIKTKEDIKKIRNADVNAVLVGEAFLEAKDIESKIKQIIGDEKSR